MTPSPTFLPESQPLRAAVWMALGVVSFTLMAVCGRALSGTFDTFEILLYRSVAGVVIVLACASLAGTRSEIDTRKLDLHLARNVSHFAGQNLWFHALTVLPLAQVIALEFTSPIWVVLLAPLVLREPLTRLRLFAVLLGFAGVLIVVRPDPVALDPGALAALGAAVGFAGSALMTRRLTRTASITCILFWLTVMQTLLGLICAGYDGDIQLPDAETLPWLGLLAVAGLAAHFCLTTALGLAPAALVMPMDFVRLPVIAAVGLLFYGESVDIWLGVGGLVILGANWLNIRGGASRASLVR